MAWIVGIQQLQREVGATDEDHVQRLCRDRVDVLDPAWRLDQPNEEDVLVRFLEVGVEAVAAAGAVPGRARGRAERASPLWREPGQVVGEPRRLGVLEQR